MCLDNGRSGILSHRIDSFLLFEAVRGRGGLKEQLDASSEKHAQVSSLPLFPALAGFRTVAGLPSRESRCGADSRL